MIPKKKTAKKRATMKRREPTTVRVDQLTRILGSQRGSEPTVLEALARFMDDHHKLSDEHNALVGSHARLQTQNTILLNRANENRIAAGAWQQTAEQHLRNEQFYYLILQRVGAYLGPDVYISDDGSIQDSVLVLKMEEVLCHKLLESRKWYQTWWGKHISALLGRNHPVVPWEPKRSRPACANEASLIHIAEAEETPSAASDIRLDL